MNEAGSFNAAVFKEKVATYASRSADAALAAARNAVLEEFATKPAPLFERWISLALLQATLIRPSERGNLTQHVHVGHIIAQPSWRGALAVSIEAGVDRKLNVTVIVTISYTKAEAVVPNQVVAGVDEVPDHLATRRRAHAGMTRHGEHFCVVW